MSQRKAVTSSNRVPVGAVTPPRERTSSSAKRKAPGSYLVNALTMNPCRERKAPSDPLPKPGTAATRWVGANHLGDAVFGVAASESELGAVNLITFMAASSPCQSLLHRTLTTYEARRLAEHLTSAAEEAERSEALQLLATA